MSHSFIRSFITICEAHCVENVESLSIAQHSAATNDTQSKRSVL